MQSEEQENVFDQTFWIDFNLPVNRMEAKEVLK